MSIEVGSTCGDDEKPENIKAVDHCQKLMDYLTHIREPISGQILDRDKEIEQLRIDICERDKEIARLNRVVGNAIIGRGLDSGPNKSNELL